MAASQPGAVGKPNGSAGAAGAPADGDAVIGSGAHVRQVLARLQGVLVDARARRDERDPTFALADSLVGTTASAWRVPPCREEEELRASVRAYACQLRADELPSERMLVLMKFTVREAIPLLLDAGEARALVDDLVRESIEAFYAFEPDAVRPREIGEAPGERSST